MNEQLKSLTWKYFWKQKFKEVGLFFGILILSIGVLYLLSYLGRWINLDILKVPNPLVKANETFFQHIFYGIFGFVYLSSVIILLCLIVSAFCEWINSNWKKAKQRAKMELVRSKEK